MKNRLLPGSPEQIGKPNTTRKVRSRRSQKVFRTIEGHKNQSFRTVQNTERHRTKSMSQALSESLFLWNVLTGFPCVTMSRVIRFLVPRAKNPKRVSFTMKNPVKRSAEQGLAGTKIDSFKSALQGPRLALDEYRNRMDSYIKYTLKVCQTMRAVLAGA